jgi:hypothetical protein
MFAAGSGVEAPGARDSPAGSSRVLGAMGSGVSARRQVARAHPPPIFSLLPEGKRPPRGPTLNHSLTDR